MAQDPNLEWLGYLQPVGLVVSPNVLGDQGLVPADQIRADTDEYQALLTDTGPAVADPWQIANAILGWPESHIAGAPGGPDLPENQLRVYVPEAETELKPDWAVAKPGGGWQLLVQRLPHGIEMDKRGALQGWEATAHQRLERLLRETGIPIGLLIGDEQWRLIYAPRGETSGHITFPLRSMGLVAGRPMLGAFKLLLDRARLFTDPPDKRLPAILAASRDAQASVSAALASQVLGALHELLRGLRAAEPERLDRIAKEQPQRVYEGLLTVLLRLIFLLYAEDRDLIPSRPDGLARALYHRSYGIRGLHARLRQDSARNPDTMHERYGAWGQLLATFRLVHAGDRTGWIRGRGGDLFDPQRFPFLQGQDTPASPVAIPRISDGAVLRVLDGLMMLNGERLSYRTLDVEQIGSVYETVIGFMVLRAPGPCLAIKAGKHNRTPVFVDLAELTGRKGKDRLKALKEIHSRSQINAKLGRAVETAGSVEEMARALLPIVDERGSPGGAITAPGDTILQPTDERRRTGSHYTPRSLTEPIVRHALEPAFARIGQNATPEQVLALKVCDPAMGSGAFLVEACRQLATRLAAAWARHPGTRPPIAPDEDEELLARRLVAQRCLYGVDRNPLAAELARLSLWLATLARDHEFTFLDHALKSGDSLVGLTARQIGGLRWSNNQLGVEPFSGFLRERIRQMTAGRSAIREAPDDVSRAIQEQRHREVDRYTREVRLLGDATLAAFFSSKKPKAREEARKTLGVAAGMSPDQSWPRINEAAATLARGAYPLQPFHWEIEFPEVFAGDNGGFDAIVGNPPFAGKNTLINGHRDYYLDWLQTLHERAHGNADLVAHFFRRAFSLLRPGGCLGLIATNTIGQGDTRESGLQAVIADGGSIIRAIRRLPWPGEAAVVVSIVHILHGDTTSNRVLDDQHVRRISAYLVEGDLDANPVPLATNGGKAFVGMYLLGLGFTFDDKAAEKGKASPVSEMHRLIDADPRNVERIFPYLGGEELNSDPRHAHHRWCIDFNDFPLCHRQTQKSWAEMNRQEKVQCRINGRVPPDYADPVAADWPELKDITKRLVKPERDNQKRDALRIRWWQYAEKRPGLRAATAGLDHVLALSRVSSHHAVARVPAVTVCAETIVVFADDRPAFWAILQSRSHELWAAFFASSLKSDLRYGPSDCFDPYPFPEPNDLGAALHEAARDYYEERATAMVARDEGLTKIYNRFHDAAEHSDDIKNLRALHHEMDVAVLRAYGWNDLADTAAPQFLTEETEPEYRYQGRLFWPAPFRDEVLRRLLDLNQARARDEAAAGLSPVRRSASEETETEEAV